MNEILRRILLIVIGIVGIIDTTALLFYNVGVNVGVILPGIVGIIFLVAGGYKLCYNLSITHRLNPQIRRLMAILFTVWLLSFIMVEGMIVKAQGDTGKQKVDYVIILGAGLKGERMTLTLQSRVRK